MRKPDLDIFRLALDIAQTSAAQAIFIDNRPMLVQIEERLDIRSILHVDSELTYAKLPLRVADASRTLAIHKFNRTVSRT
jgi:putative hydrolase of the HAD superfamily